MMHEHSVNGVILSAKHSYFEQVEEVIRACEIEGVEAWLVAEFFKTQISRTSLDDFYGRPVMVFRTTPEASWQGVLKQLLDRVGAILLLAFLSPFFLVISVLIKVGSRGPVLFRQKRSGLNGSPFTFYKFRTMVTNAEQLKHELAAMNEMTGLGNGQDRHAVSSLSGGGGTGSETAASQPIREGIAVGPRNRTGCSSKSSEGFSN